MKAKTMSKRVLSVILCTVMLFSCWVFTAPTAQNAYADSAGSYKVIVRWTCDDTCSKYKDGYSWDGNRSDNGKNYCGWTLHAKKNNGASSDEVHFDKDCASVMRSDSSSWWNEEFTINGFPYKLTTHNDNGKWDDGELRVTQIQVYNYKTSTWVMLWQGTLKTNSWTDIKANSVDWDGNLSGDGDKSSDSGYGSWKSKCPTVNSGGGLSCTNNIYLDGTNNKENTITIASAQDQYGVTYATSNCTLTKTSNYHDSDISISGNKVTISKDAHEYSTTGQNTITVTVTGSWATVNSSGAVTKTTQFTVYDEKLTGTYIYYETNTNNLDSPTQKSKTAQQYYGDNFNTVIPDGMTNYYHTSSKHYYNGSFSSSADTWAKELTTDYTFTMRYTEAEHDFGDWVRENDTNHKKTCSQTTCQYVVREGHNIKNVQYSTSATKHWKVCTVCSGKVNETDHSWKWVSDGSTSSSTHTKVCSVCGYRDTTSTATHSVGGWKSDSTNHWKECSVCKAKVDNVGHTQGEKQTENVVAPTCTKAGHHDEVFYCKVCNRELSRTTVTDAALGHNVAGVELTNDDAEGHYRICKRCAEPIKSDGITIGKDTHQMSDWAKKDGDKHTRTCTVCGYTETGDHNFKETVHAPTCTEQGYTEYKCKTCPYSYEDDYVTALGHLATGAYQSDSSNHWKICQRAGCGVDIYDNNGTWTAGRTGHSLNEGEVTTQPTCTETGIKTFTCTVCGNTNNTTTVDALGHNYTVNNVRDATTLKKAATCTENGEYWYTCSRCGDVSDSLFYVVETEGEIGYKLGHHWVRWDGCSEEKISELSGAVPVIFKCENGCNKFCSSYYDEETHEYKSTGNAGDYKYVIGQDTASIPTPSFNEHFEHFDGQVEPYKYSDRKASLRVRPSEKDDPTQAMRFSGNLSAGNIVAAGVQFNVNPNLIYDNNELMSLSDIRTKNLSDKAKKAQGETVADAFPDDTIIDFGFVFTQARFIRTKKTEIDYDLMTLDNIGTNYRIYRMSVVENNKGNGTLSNNWKGLTMIGEEATFNLVIDVNEKNYQATYVARTYVIYKYHGDIICVYDQPYENYERDNEKGENVPNHYYSHDSVYNQAHKVLTLTEPTDFVKSYLEDKIINNTATQNFVDWNVNYTLKDFPKVEED